MVRIDSETLGQLMAIVQELGTGEDLDDILEHIALAVVDVIGFGAVAVNVVTRTGDLEVRAVIGPPEMEGLLGGVLSQDGWLQLLDASEHWGELRFCRSPILDESVPHVDPWSDRLAPQSSTAKSPDVEPWQPEFALLVPLWSGPRELLGVISVDLPRSGHTPDFEQRALLELFGTQAAAAISRVHAFDLATNKATLYRTAFAASPAPTLMLDAQLCVTDVNAAFMDMADAVTEDVIGRSISELVALPDVAAVGSLFAAVDSRVATVVAEECALRHPRGHPLWRWVQVQARRVEGAAIGAHYVCILTDRTAVRRSMDALRQRAETDDLTGLSLRAVGVEKLAARCAPPTAPSDDHVAHAPVAARAVLYCDLDNFKRINDVDGHRVGDDVLIAVAHCLRRVAEDADLVCRWGGDEFVLVVERPTMQQIVELGHRLVAAVRQLGAEASPDMPMRDIDLSVGVAEFTPPADPSAVLEAADRALYRAKADPFRRVHVHMQ